MAGRPQLGTSLDSAFSRQKFKCPVVSCKSVMRSDKLRNHLNSKVVWTPNGKPVPRQSVKFFKANKSKQAHTEYFLENSLNENDLPSMSRMVPFGAPGDPFEAAAMGVLVPYL